MARILVTGASGQIGSYLAELLLEAGHVVIALAHERALPGGVVPAKGALTAEGAETLVGGNGSLDAIVHLAGQSSMTRSWEAPMETFEVNGRLGVALAFAAARTGVRFVHASSGELFGVAPAPVLDETTPIAPRSPYAVAKASAHMAVQFCRQAYDSPASNLIFFLAESPRRAPQFVVRKITTQVARIVCGRADNLTLGNTSAVRDFTHARDFARAAAMFALGAPPGDYVCGSGQPHTIHDVAVTACRIAGIDPERVLRTDPALFRPNDIPSLVANSARLRALGWAPTVAFEDLVREIYEHALASVRSEAGA
jgi:GDPmannose 4,6-dehydratase